MKLLHIDDDRNDQQLLLHSLRMLDADIEISYVENAIAALELLENESFDCIISDYQMPEMNGLELLAALRERHNHTPFVIRTGIGLEKLGADALQAGCDDFFLKEISFSHFQRLYSSILLISESHKNTIKLKETEISLRRGHEFEELSDEIALAFVNAGSAKIDEVINMALEQTARISGIERSSLYIFSDDCSRLTNTHEWCETSDDSRQDLLQDVEFSEFGYFRTELLANRIIQISKLGDFPPEATGEMAWVEKFGFRASLYIPLFKNGRLKGALGYFGKSEIDTEWSADLVHLFKTVGNQILNLLERKWAEEELKASEARFKAFSETSFEGIVITENGKILDANNMMLDLLGYNYDEFMALDISDAIFSEDLELVISKIQSRDEEPYEIRFVTKDGNVLDMEVCGKVIDYQGKECRITVIRDITERNKATKKLKSSVERFEAVMDSIDAVVYVSDFDTYEVLYLNRFGKEIFGEVGERKCWQLLQKDQTGPCDFCTNDHLLDENNQPTGIYRWEHHNLGSGQWFDCHDQAIQWDDGRLVRLEIATDISDRKNAESILEKAYSDLKVANDDLEAFSHTVAHDLKAPLRHMAGYADILASDYADNLDEDGRKYLQKVSDSSEKMSRLVDDILRFSEMSITRLKIEKVDLSEITLELVEEMKRQEPSREIQITIEDEIEVEGDRGFLQIVLQNLLSNAWKFTGKTEAAKISFGKIRSEGRTNYYVKDNGVGFDSANAEKLFEPFQRFHDKSQFSGTGVGLSTVKRIIQRHNGEIWAESEPDNGAAFYFTIG